MPFALTPVSLSGIQLTWPPRGPYPGRSDSMIPPTQDTTSTSDVSKVTVVGDGFVPMYLQDPEHTMRAPHFSDPAFAEAILSFPIVCTDFVLVNRDRRTFFLATRRQLPMPGLWWIGGR